MQNMPPKSRREAVTDAGKGLSKGTKRQKICRSVGSQITNQVSQMEDSSRSLRHRKVSLKVFGTKIWADGIVDAHKKRITDYQSVRKNYDALETDMHRLGRRWDQLLTSIRMPFKTSPPHHVADSGYERIHDLSNEFSQPTSQYNNYLLHALHSTDDGKNVPEPADDPLADM